MTDNLDLQGPLGDGVRHIRASASSHDAEQRITEFVLANQVPRKPAPTAGHWAIWSGAIAAMLLLALGTWAVRDRLFPSHSPPRQVAVAPITPPTTPVPPNPSNDGVTPTFGGITTTPNPRGISPANARGATPRGGIAQGMGIIRVTNFFTVAANARVAVGNGPDTPLRLGGQMQAGGTNLHIWTWNENDADSLKSESRVLKATHDNHLALTPDGKSIVTSDGRLIDVASGEAKPIPNFDGRVKGMFFAPDATALLLFVADDGPITATLRMLEFPSGKKHFELKNMFGATSEAAFSPDGKQLFLMHPGFQVYQHDAATGEQRFGYEPALGNSLRAIAVSPDGKLLAAAASRDQTQVWEVATGKLLHRLLPRQTPRTYENGGIQSLLFSPDGKYLAATGVSQALLWDLATEEVAQVFATGTGGDSELRFYDPKTLTAVSNFRHTTAQDGTTYLALPAVRMLNLPATTQPK